jgi:hypothetical protein
MKEPEKKVDSSWKDQVENERIVKKTEDPQEPVENEPTAAAGPAAEQPAEQPAADAEPAEENRAPLGQPGLTPLVSQLAMQTMYSLGLVEMPDGQAPPADLEQAKYLIELLVILQEKTEGNLTDEETAALTETLHQLRMAFVAVTNKNK